MLTVAILSVVAGFFLGLAICHTKEAESQDTLKACIEDLVAQRQANIRLAIILLGKEGEALKKHMNEETEEALRAELYTKYVKESA